MERKDMKELLSAKDILNIAKDTDYSRSLVYSWFSGNRNNLDIEAKVLEKVAIALERTKELKERIKNAL